MKIEKIDTQEYLLAYIMNIIAEKFPSNAVLKGGMALRLTNSPRLTNDLDYVFIPFKSKKEIVKLLLDCLEDLPGVSCKHQLNSKCLRIILSTENNISIQIEANVMKECKTAILTTGVLAKEYSLMPRVIKIMSFEVALANKLAAWCERRLVRDIFDVYYIFSVLDKKPDLEILISRLKRINYARNVKNKPVSLSVNEFSSELHTYIADLTQEKIEKEIGTSFPSEELIGLDLIIKNSITKLINFLNNSWTQKH